MWFNRQILGGLDVEMDGESAADMADRAASPGPQGEDESLNAYIERLENLQARLGNGMLSINLKLKFIKNGQQLMVGMWGGGGIKECQ